MTVDTSSNAVTTAARRKVYRFPASSAQRRLWFLDRLEPGGSSYNVPAALRIQGVLDVKSLERSLQEIVRRHESLRTRFTEIQGEPYQIVDAEATIELQVIDLGGATSAFAGAVADNAATENAGYECTVRKLAEKESHKPFDLRLGPLFRVRLLRLGADEHALLLTMHHIISDGWSVSILVREVSLLYAAFVADLPSPLPELPIQYGDYSIWQQEWMNGEALQRQLNYWRGQLAGVKAWELPADHPRPAVRGQRGSTLEFTVSAGVTAKLKDLSRRQGVTLFMTMLAAWEVLLYRYSGHHDLTVGTPIAGRTRTETEGLIGFFVNTLVLRGDLNGRPSFTELLQRARHKTLEAYAHQDVPFERLVEELQPERSLSRSPLFHVMFVLQNAPTSELELGGVKLQLLNVESATAKFDLTLGLMERTGQQIEGEMLGSLEYSTDLFEKTSISRMIGHYQMLLDAVLSGSDHAIDALQMLPEAEWRQILHEWNETEVKYPNEQCPYEIFEDRAEVTGSVAARLTNNKLFVLDKWYGIVPVGLPGELYVGGDGVSRGYLGGSELTAEKFVPNPFSMGGGERLYRTGTRVKWRDGGKLEFLGHCEDLAEPEKRERAVEKSDNAALTPTEELITGMWCTLLGKSDIRRDDNFFDLGGHSLLVTQVLSRIREVFQVELPLQVMFETPTVAALACTVENSRKIDTPPLVGRSRPQRPPLSFGQERLRFLGGFDRETSAYNIPVALRVRGALNIDAAKASLQEIVARHEALRTSFPEVGDSTIQDIAAEMEVPFAVSEIREDELDQVLRKQAQQSFDLSHGPLIQASLFRLGSQDHVLLVVLHHIVFDGWSLGVMLREFNALYDAFNRSAASPLPSLPIQYADYSTWQREWLQGEVLERQLEYWRKQLAGVKRWELPTDHPRPPVRSQRGATLEFTLSAETTAKLKDLSQRQGVTLFMTMLAAWEVLLYRYSGQQDLTVGTPIAGRTRTGTEGLIGFFVNTLVLRGDLSGKPSFTELLQRVRCKTLEAYAHQDVPFERLVGELQPERDLSRSPLFPVLFVMQNAPMSELEIGGVRLQWLHVPGDTAKFDMTLGLSESMEVEGEMQGSLEYSTDLFEKATIVRMIEHYRTLLEAAVRGNEESIEELRILPDAERHQLLYEWNETRVEFGDAQCVHEMFEEQAERAPEAVAVEYEGRQITYGELNRRANQLAHYLRELGVEPDARVAICTEQGSEAIIGLLAILKAGGAYVRLDSADPKRRLNHMLADSTPIALLAQEHVGNLFSEHRPALTVIDVSQAAPPWHNRPETNLDKHSLGLSPRHLAYLHYTSDSSGYPKGVMVEHGALRNALEYLKNECRSGPGDVWLAMNTLASDIAEFKVHLPLTMGATLRLLDRDATLDDRRLAKELKNGVTGVQATPAAFRVLLENNWPGTEEIKVLYSGEGLNPDIAEKLVNRGASVWNSYGTTETLAYSLTRRREVVEHVTPVGRPTANVRGYILDGEGEPVPIGVSGELYIGGAGVARGYLNRPELTAERFLEDRFAKDPGARMYRTGDWARWLPDGNIQFLGQNRFQVNILGFRVELGEIEQALMAHPKVQEAVVMVVDNKVGDKRLVAYFTCRGGGEPGEDIVGAEDLRNQLMLNLPEHMMPAEYLRLERMPLTTNGKLDRLALRALETNKKEAPSYEAPVGKIETTLAGIWAELLKVERVGRFDDFFALGGHSLLVATMRSMIHEQLHYDLPLEKLFYNPCIAELAKQLEHIPEQCIEHTQQPRSSILVEIQPRGPRTPFFCVHPVGGQVVCYADLANELGADQPFYGLQSPVPSSFSDPNLTIERMATLYNHEVKRTRTVGPYLLGGWSMGGLVAYEMARQLREDGQLVGLVALFDTHLPARQREILDETRDSRFKQNMLARFALDMAQLLGKNVENLRENFLQLEYEQQFQFVQKMLTREGMLSRSAAHDEMTNLLEVFSRNSAAMDSYSVRSSEQPIVLFAAAHGKEEPNHLREEWELRIGHGVDLRRVPGHHYTMLRKSQVSILAKLLGQLFDDVRSEDRFALANDRK
jgi:amino acid adenylation domain-containing protein